MTKPKKDGLKRGFSSMDRETQRRICSMGAKTLHEKGKAHVFTSDEARRAGLIGGKIISAIPGHMSRLGKLAGEARRKRIQARALDINPTTTPAAVSSLTDLST